MLGSSPDREGIDLDPDKSLPLKDSPPPFHIDAVTGTVTARDPWGEHPLEHWTPQPRPLHGIAISSYGGVIVARNGSVYVNGERLLVIEGPVLDLSLIGGNSTLNGHLALLTPNAILSFTFCAASEDDEGYVVLNERIPITQWTHRPLGVPP